MTRPTPQDDVKPGQDWAPPPARLHNAWNAAARAVLPNSDSVRIGNRNPDDHLSINVKNTSGSDIAIGDIVGFGNPLLLVSSVGESREQVTFGYASPAVGKWAVASDGIDKDFAGRCVLVGVAWAQVNVTDANHTHADVSGAGLVSGDSGYAKILYKPAGTGTDWCCLQLGLPDGSGSGTKVRNVILDSDLAAASCSGNETTVITTTGVFADYSDPSTKGATAEAVTVYNVHKVAFPDADNLGCKIVYQVAQEPGGRWEILHSTDTTASTLEADLCKLFGLVNALIDGTGLAGTTIVPFESGGLTVQDVVDDLKPGCLVQVCANCVDSGGAAANNYTWQISGLPTVNPFDPSEVTDACWPGLKAWMEEECTGTNSGCTTTFTHPSGTYTCGGKTYGWSNGGAATHQLLINQPQSSTFLFDVTGIPIGPWFAITGPADTNCLATRVYNCTVSGEACTLTITPVF